LFAIAEGLTKDLKTKLFDIVIVIIKSMCYFIIA